MMDKFKIAVYGYSKEDVESDYVSLLTHLTCGENRIKSYDDKTFSVSSKYLTVNFYDKESWLQHTSRKNTFFPSIKYNYALYFDDLINEGCFDFGTKHVSKNTNVDVENLVDEIDGYFSADTDTRPVLDILLSRAKRKYSIRHTTNGKIYKPYISPSVKILHIEQIVRDIITKEYRNLKILNPLLHEDITWTVEESGCNREYQKITFRSSKLGRSALRVLCYDSCEDYETIYKTITTIIYCIDDDLAAYRANKFFGDVKKDFSDNDQYFIKIFNGFYEVINYMDKAMGGNKYLKNVRIVDWKYSERPGTLTVTTKKDNAHFTLSITKYKGLDVRPYEVKFHENDVNDMLYGFERLWKGYDEKEQPEFITGEPVGFASDVICYAEYAKRYLNETFEIKGDNLRYKQGEYVGYAKSCINEKFGIKGDNNMYTDMRIKKVIFNKPAVIVFWKDGTKTIVKCGEKEKWDPEKGLAMAISRKALGNGYDYYDIFEKFLPKGNK